MACSKVSTAVKRGAMGRGKTLAGERQASWLVCAAREPGVCGLFDCCEVGSCSHAAFWLLVWAVVASAGALAAEGSYTVKRGRHYLQHCAALWHPACGARRAQWAQPEFLRLRRPAADDPGQVHGSAAGILRRCSRAQNIARVALPRSIQRAIDQAPVRPGRWQYIVIHHSGVDTGTVKAMDKYHREVRHMENGLAYHFVIGNGSGMGDGEIAVGRRWTQQLDGGHLASEAQNKVAIGICLVGNFDKHQPTAREMESLRALVEALMARCKLTPARGQNAPADQHRSHALSGRTSFPRGASSNSLQAAAAAETVGPHHRAPRRAKTATATLLAAITPSAGQS